MPTSRFDPLVKQSSQPEHLPAILRIPQRPFDAGQDSAIESMRRQIHEMHMFMTSAFAEISSLRPRNIRDIEIPEATDELHAVVDATKMATNIILDSAEKIEHLAALLPCRHSQEWQSLIVKIYEASNFQDITGQRIKKVVATLRGIETRVARLVALFPDTGATQDDAATGCQNSLLNGPQLPECVANQDDIDALFGAD